MRRATAKSEWPKGADTCLSRCRSPAKTAARKRFTPSGRLQLRFVVSSSTTGFQRSLSLMAITAGMMSGLRVTLT